MKSIVIKTVILAGLICAAQFGYGAAASVVDTTSTTSSSSAGVQPSSLITKPENPELARLGGKYYRILESLLAEIDEELALIDTKEKEDHGQQEKEELAAQKKREKNRAKKERKAKKVQAEWQMLKEFAKELAATDTVVTKPRIETIKAKTLLHSLARKDTTTDGPYALMYTSCKLVYEETFEEKVAKEQVIITRMPLLSDEYGRIFSGYLNVSYEKDVITDSNLTLLYNPDWVLRFQKGVPLLSYPAHPRDPKDPESNTLFVYNSKKMPRLLAKKLTKTMTVEKEEYFAGDTYIQLADESVHEIKELVLYLVPKK